MHNSLFFHVLQRAGNLIGEFPHNLFVYVVFFLPDTADVIFEVPAFRPFYCYEHFIIFYEGFYILSDVIMPQTLHQFYFLDTIISLFHVVNVENFEQF